MTVFRTHYIADVKKIRTPAQRAVQSHIKREFFCVNEQLTVSEVITMLKATHQSSMTGHVVIVINHQAEFLGLVAMNRLVCANTTQSIVQLISGSAHYTFGLTEDYPAALQLRKSQWPILPVLDSRHRVLGVLELNTARAIIRRQLELGSVQVSKSTSWGWNRFIQLLKR
ncbi:MULTISPECIES: magnesium transporter [Vibrio]|uniref:hypothetical protein n=1 Tax=Vibrio TaxID=662 RepID=UPI000D386555|nr:MULTISPECIES: hypothetical protein [Vibrio]MBN7277598.1 hypothetical protein [Vibrio paracholerae]MBN7281343.1 hypothetical protein [Vibrio paracholerae]MBP8548556.1 hypothetical protein [Vibrio paracholerae]MCX9580931.1 hypothetical protein [Vibrio cholerae]MCX9583272.1 hypothetical protein [Vibrio cholerae]